MSGCGARHRPRRRRARARDPAPPSRRWSPGSPDWTAQQELEARRNGAESLAVSGRMVGAAMPRLTDLDVRLADMDAAGRRRPGGLAVAVPLPLLGRPRRSPGTSAAAANRASPSSSRRARTGCAGWAWCRCSTRTCCVEALDDAVLAHGLAGSRSRSHAPALEDGRAPGRAVRRAAGAVLGQGRRARRGRLPAPLRLHPRRAAGPVLPGEHRRPAGRERRRAVAPDLRRGPRPAPRRCASLAAHGGGYLPTYLGRSDHAWQVRPEARGCAATAEQLPAPDLVRLARAHPGRAARASSTAVGADRVLLGSDYPFDMGVDRPASRASPPRACTADQAAAVAGGNAARLGLAVADPCAPLRPPEETVMTVRPITHLRHVDLAVPDLGRPARLLHRTVGADRGRRPTAG